MKLDASTTCVEIDPQRAQAICASLLFLCGELQLVAIAEGVETYAQAQLLADLGCRMGQGYFYGSAEPLGRLVSAMQAITGGNLDITIPAEGHDEMGAMAHTLKLFRNSQAERERLTAERERAEAAVRQMQARLTDAIESISQGFALFDPEDRLVVCNSRYREILYPDLGADITPGMSFEAIIRRAAEGGRIEAAEDRIDAWVAERLAQHRDPGAPILQHRADGRWIQVTERRTHDGGIVAVYSDITDLKRAEQALQESVER